MKKILIVNLGTQCQCFASTCVLKGLRQLHGQNISVLCMRQCSQIFKRNNIVKQVIAFQDIQNTQIFVDQVYNLNPLFLGHPKVTSTKYFGINYTNHADQASGILFGEFNTNRTLFQLYHEIANLQWRGNGFYFQYFPRNKKRKGKTGVALSNVNLKHYMCDKLKLQSSQLWMIPFRKNILKKFDQINVADYLITDDLLTLNIALHLRKQVYFMKTQKYNFQIIPFGSVEIFDISSHFLNVW